MGKDVLVVSLGRILADQVKVEPAEACAVLRSVWRHLLSSGAEDGGVGPVPTLDQMGVTAFGDFEIRRSHARAPRSVRPPHVLSHELVALLVRLLASGRSEITGPARACLDAARHASGGAGPAAVPVVTPEALLRSLEAHRLDDDAAALGALFARWRRKTDRAHAATWQEIVAANPVLAAADAPSGSATFRPVARSAPPVPLAVAAPPGSATVARREIPREGRRSRAVSAAIRVAAAAVLCLGLAAGMESWRRASSDAYGIVVDATSVATADGERPRTRRLLHAPADGRVPYSPAFDPTGHAIVFHAGLDGAALLEASIRRDGTVDGVSTLVPDGPSRYHVQVSPDGRRLAYAADAGGTRGIYIARRDGSSPRLVSGSGHASVPTWSPDGATIAFVRAEPDDPQVWNVWTLDVATGTLERQTRHHTGKPWGASWFPDGTRIAYGLEDRVVVRDLETGAERAYPTPVAGGPVRTPAVSPDGESIVFQVRGDGAWVLDLGTGESTRLIADGSAQEFAWSPDGDRIAYHSVQGGRWGIWMLDLEPRVGP